MAAYSAIYLVAGFALIAFVIFLIFWPLIIWIHIKKHTENLQKQTEYLKTINTSILVIREEFLTQSSPSKDANQK